VRWPMQGLNDEDLIGRGCVRGFVYSEGDKVIDWRDVEDFAGVAERKGYRVLREKVEDAEHVQLFKGKGGEKRYWGLVAKVWAVGMGLDGEQDGAQE